MNRLTYGSLFSGVGGMDMGFDTHMDCVFQVEWDKHAQSILRRHWPDVPKWGDVQEVNGADLPPCDVLTFGSPCQDLSVAGKRAGLDGGRSSMFYEAVRIIKEMRDATSSRPTGPLPRAVLWENVPGALSSNNGADFKSVVDEMVDLGACLVEWAVLDAQHFGVPQRRRRIFLVAIFDPATAERCPDPLLPVSQGRRGDFAKGRKKGQDVAGSVATSVDAGGLQPTVGCLTPGAHAGSYNGQDAYNDLLIPFVKARRAQNDTDDETWVEGEVTPTLNAFDNGGESRATVLMPIPIQGTIIGRSDTAGPQGQGIGEPDGVMFTLDRVSMHGVAQPIPIQDGREIEKHQNGFGIADEGSPMYTVDTTGGQAVAQPIIFDGTRHDDFRMDTEIVPTLKQRMGTGGGQVPMVFEPGAVGRLNGERYSEEVSHTLRANMGDNLPAVVQPVAASFKPGASAKAYGIGYEEEMAPTLESGGGGNNKPAIIQPVTVFQPGAMIRLGGGVSDDIVPTLRAEAKRGDNEPHIATSLAVRRLTPLECERLMGWPDHHTRYTDLGTEQADTHRYKQCGNGVAAPVARWIAGHLTRILG